MLKTISEAAAFLKINGYAVIPKFISPTKCQEAVDQVDRLTESFQPKKDQITIFAATDGNNDHKSSKYYLDSAGNVSFFYEAQAWKDGKLVVPKKRAINKIGHALHQFNPLFKDITYTPGVWEICQLLGINQPRVMQSTVILKPPKIGGVVHIHQDQTYIGSDTLLGFWIPLQDSTLNNGCLWGLPGSHKGPLYIRATMHNGVPKEQRLHEVDYNQADFVPIEMQKGSLAIFTGKFLHKSRANTSQISRYAYTWHLMDRNSEYSADNWLQRQSYPEFVVKEKLN